MRLLHHLQAGFGVSKIKNLKAIHNISGVTKSDERAGFSVSKIKNLKAIHNVHIVQHLLQCAGFSVSKIKNLKAIHNPQPIEEKDDEAGFSVSKIKNLKAIHNILSNSSLEESVYTIHSLVDYAIYRWRIEKVAICCIFRE